MMTVEWRLGYDGIWRLALALALVRTMREGAIYPQILELTIATNGCGITLR